MKRTLSIRVRLAILISIFTILPTLAIVSFTIFTLQNTLKDEIVDSNRFQMEWTNQFIDDLYLRADSIFNTIQIYPDLMENLEISGDEDVETQLESYNYMRDLLNVFYYSNALFIDNLSVGTKAGLKTFSIDNSIQRVSALNAESLPWEDANMYFEGMDGSIVIRRAVKRFEDRVTVGYLSIRLRESVTSQLLNILQIDEKSSIILLDSQNRILLQRGNPVELDFAKIGFEKEMQTIDQRFVFTTSVRSGALKVIKVVPMSVVDTGSSSILLGGLAISILFVGLAIVLSYVFSTRITKPIISLANTMKSVDIEAFKLREVDEQNEIGLLETGYNVLMLRTRNLIDQEYKREIELKNAQLKALQAQINPHFLYNILQMVGGIALSHNVDEIYHITNIIADLFRYSISGGSDLVSVGDEVKHIKNYLYIQNLRFGDRIETSVEVDEAATEVMIPKFTIQPLVENAFEHGLHETLAKGELKIWIRDEEHQIKIHVRDNGEGIPLDLLETLKGNLKNAQPLSDDTKFGIGMKNVDARLRLLFGEAYDFEILSEENKYTEIVLTLPKRKTEGKHV